MRNLVVADDREAVFALKRANKQVAVMVLVAPVMLIIGIVMRVISTPVNIIAIFAFLFGMLVSFVIHRFQGNGCLLSFLGFGGISILVLMYTLYQTVPDTTGFFICAVGIYATTILTVNLYRGKYES